MTAGGGSAGGDAVGDPAEQASGTARRTRIPGMNRGRRAECNREDGIIPVNGLYGMVKGTHCNQARRAPTRDAPTAMTIMMRRGLGGGVTPPPGLGIVYEG